MINTIKTIHDWVKENTFKSGCFSVTSIFSPYIVTFSILPTILTLLQLMLTIIGGIVGCITIYTWLEKKDFLPKWAQRADKQIVKDNNNNQKN